MSLCILGACLIAAQLTHGDIGYSNDMPTTATSYDGVERDISEFYEDEQTNFYLGGYILTQNTCLLYTSPSPRD